MDWLQTLGRGGLGAWQTLNSVRTLMVQAGAALWGHGTDRRSMQEHLFRMGVEGGSTAITAGAVSGLLMIGVPLIFAGELALERVGGLLGVPVVRILAPTVAAAVIAGRAQIDPSEDTPLGQQAATPILAGTLAALNLWVLTALGALMAGYVLGGVVGGLPVTRLFLSFAGELVLMDVVHGAAKAALFGAVVGVVRSHQALIRRQPRGALRAVLACLLLDGLLNLPWLLRMM
ncbi:MAG: ABC transporter permease [Myxococcota bacterium]|nr:ABC transporter permease [Myxococcota bacterium]